MTSDEEILENVCLFCLQEQTEGFGQTILENAVLNGINLKIRLNDPSKNEDAFNLICSLLDINYTREKRKRNYFDWKRSLPLCFKCQNLYQEVFHLHVQVNEINRLIKERAELISTIICESELKQGDNDKRFSRKWSSIGLGSFREKVLNLKQVYSRRNTRAQSKHQVTKPKTENVPSLSLPVKTEPENQLFDLEDAIGLGLPWEDEDGSLDDFESAVHDTNLTSFINENEQNELDGHHLKEVEPEKKMVDVHHEPFKENKNSARAIKQNDSDFSADNKDESSESESDSSYDSSYTRRTRRTKRPQRLKGSSKIVCKRNGRGGRQPYLPRMCHICKEELIGHNAFDQHYLEKHPGEKKYTCIYCKKYFSRLRGVHIHQRKHEKIKNPVICEICNKHFSSEESRRSHKRTIHKIGIRDRNLSSSQKVRHECHLCHEVVHGSKLFSEHYKKIHPEEKRYSCKYCKRRFIRIRAVLSHQRNKHEKIILDPKKGEVDGSNLVVAILDPVTGEIKEKKKFRRRGKTTGKRTNITYTCHLCDEEVIGAVPFKKHYEAKHPEEKRYTCKFCQRHFLRLRDVEGHQRKHTGEKPHECVLCNKRFSSLKMKHYHDKVRHGPQGSLYTCEKCGKDFLNAATLKNHIEAHKGTVVICLTCGGSYKTKVQFQSHNKRMHEGTANCSDPLRDPSEKQVESLGVKFKSPLKCFVCWSHIPRSRDVDQHFEEQHKGTNPYKCPKCDKTCVRYKDMIKHVYRHFGSLKTVQCDKCPRKFWSKHELNIHSRVHLSEDEKPKYICDICGSSFASRHSLSLHSSRKHDPNAVVNKWICEICGKSYADRKGYTQHKKSAHTTNPEFKCLHCPKAYGHLWELRKHINTHAAQKPYKCPQCDMRFSYTTSRLRHVKEIHQKMKIRRLPNQKLRRKSTTSLKSVTTDDGDTEQPTPTLDNFNSSLCGETSSSAAANFALLSHPEPEVPKDVPAFNSTANWNCPLLPTNTTPNSILVFAFRQ